MTTIIGTEIIVRFRQVDLEDSLGVNADIFTLSFNKRKEQIEAGLRPSWKPDEHCFYRRLEDRSPSPARRSGHQVTGSHKLSSVCSGSLLVTGGS